MRNVCLRQLVVNDIIYIKYNLKITVSCSYLSRTPRLLTAVRPLEDAKSQKKIPQISDSPLR
jgi:hypothetical protein